MRHDETDTKTIYEIEPETPQDLDEEYYYRDTSYENHPKKDIDGNPDNDWIPIPTLRNDLIRHRLRKSPLKKLVNNVKERLFQSDASITTAAALSLPYLALALPS